MRQLKDAIRGEVVRLTRTRLPLWTLAAAVACGGLLTGLVALTGPENTTPPMPGLDTVAGVSGVLGLLGVALFVPALIGTVAITGEYRHRTVATTFLAVPNRGRVLVAKLIAYGGLGLAYGLVLAFSAVAGIYAGTFAYGTEPGLGLGAILAPQRGTAPPQPSTCCWVSASELSRGTSCSRSGSPWATSISWTT